MIDRRSLITWLTSLAFAGPVMAHHGWRWTADGNFELTGIIKSARLGNPHGVLVPAAMAGFVLALLAGGLLFTTDASKYAAMPLFQIKLALIALGVLNALYLARNRATAWAALISLAAWTGALICGRFIGYL